jgi:hypothetical protein
MSEIFKQCPEIITHAKKWFGITEIPHKSGWLLSDGTLLDLSDGKQHKSMEHEFIKFSMENILGFYPGRPVNDFMCDCNGIRFHQTDRKDTRRNFLALYMDVCMNPTEAQWKRLKEMAETYDIDRIYFDLVTKWTSVGWETEGKSPKNGSPKSMVGDIRRQFNELKEKHYNV